MADRNDNETKRRAAELMIPGEHDHSTEGETPLGVVGTTGYGGDEPPSMSDSTLTEEDHQRNRWEGGGRIRKGDHGG